MRWAQEQRIKFILEHLDTHGWVGRAPIQEAFRVSVPTASADLRQAQKLHPDRLVYDTSAKRYVAASNAQAREIPTMSKHKLPFRLTFKVEADIAGGEDADLPGFIRDAHGCVVAHVFERYGGSDYEELGRDLVERYNAGAEVAQAIASMIGPQAERAEAIIAAVLPAVLERLRHVEVEGFSEAHDDAHDGGEMALAAACYAAHPAPVCDEDGDSLWPWADECWKPKGSLRDIDRAMSLLIAERQRLVRKGVVQ